MATSAQPLSAPDDLLAEIKSAVGAQGWSDDSGVLGPHLVDWLGRFRGRALLLVRPRTTEEVARVVGACARARVPIVPQGGNTGLVGGATPSSDGHSILLNLSRLDRVREVDPLNDTITVEAGCILADVQRAAADSDRLFPLSLAAEGSCQIGGNLSTNAGGIAVLRYGNARELTLGLEVVLPDGRVWDGLRALRKDNTGYDLKQLFIGAEGTLGIITAAVLKLFPLPRDTVTALAAVAGLDAAVGLLARLRREIGDRITSFELMSRFGIDLALRHVAGAVDPLSQRYEDYVLIEIRDAASDGELRARLERVLAEAMAEGLVLDATIPESQTQARGLWRLREAIVEGQRNEGPSIKHDIAVPTSLVPAFIATARRLVEAARPGVRVHAFGHLGDGNIHFNLTIPLGSSEAEFRAQGPLLTRIVHDAAADFAGSISAEHGLGQLRRDEIKRYKSPVELDLMRRLKSALDPDNIMNPGKVV
jgi:FAD/FMN-containing dehydrogenase